MTKHPDPRLASLARTLRSRLELEADLGVNHLQIARLSVDELEKISSRNKSAAVQTSPLGGDSQRATSAPPVINVPSTPNETKHLSPAKISSAKLPTLPMLSRMPPRKEGGVSEKDKLLEPIQVEATDCQKCRLSEGRTNVVFGEGSLDTDLLIVGEAPGRDEDVQGRPFVGRAGKLLTSIIESGMKRSRESVYICNVIKCRPPGNRPPKPDEKAACEFYLKKQIEVIRPKVIMAVGRHAAVALTGQDLPMGKLRGIWWEYEGIPLLPIYHTSYILRQRNEYARRNERCPADIFTWEDIKLIMAKLAE